MDRSVRRVLLDECHRLYSELRRNTIKSLYPEIQNQIQNLKNELWNSSIEISEEMILVPYKSIFTHENLTDVVAYVALVSLTNLIKLHIIRQNKQIESLLDIIFNMKFQITSEFDCSRVSYQILRLILLFLNSPEFNLTDESLSLILKYIVADISRLTGMKSVSLNGIEVLTQFIKNVFKQGHGTKLQKDTLLSLFYVSSTFQNNSNSVSRYMALNGLYESSKLDLGEMEQWMISISCALITQQLQSCGSKDNFFLTLRIFYNVFNERYITTLPLFARCFDLILDFVMNPNNNICFRASAFEVISDFLAIPEFVVNIYLETCDSGFYPNLFKKIIDCIALIISNPSPITDYYNVALSIIPIIFASISEQPKIRSEGLTKRGQEGEKQIADFESFVSVFNKNPSAFIDKDYSDEKLAWMMFTAPKCSPKAIGELFARNKPFCISTLEKFLKLFDFSKLDFDDSIRIFLTSFQIAGEGQIVDRILECFSNSFFESHQNEFNNATSLHLLSYGWLMLHTSNYNANAQPQTLEDFKSMLRGQNDGKDFDISLLESLYTSISRFSVPIEEEHKVNSLAYWILAQQKINKFKPEPKSDKSLTQLFESIWTVFDPILSQSYERGIINIDIFRAATAAAAKLECGSVIDSLVNTFCKSAITEITSEKAFSSLTMITKTAQDNGTAMREGWKSYVEVLIALFQLDLVSGDITTMASLNGGEEISINVHMRTKSSERRDSTSFFNFIRITRSDSEGEVNPNTAKLKEAVSEMKIGDLPSQTLRYSAQSLTSLIKAISDASEAFEAFSDANAVAIVFLTNIACKIAAANAERVGIIWNNVYGIIDRILKNSSQSRQSAFLSDMVLRALFVTIDELWCEDGTRSDMLDALDRLSNHDLLLKGRFTTVGMGLTAFMKHHASTYAATLNFLPILKLIDIGMDSNTSVGHVFHSLITKMPLGDESALPGPERFDDFWSPLLQIAELLCASEAEENYIERFRDLQALLHAYSMGGESWGDIFDKQLFAVMEGIMKKAERGLPEMWPRALMMAKTMMNAFLYALDVIVKMQYFEKTWFRILKFSLELAKSNNAEVRDSIPELLSNALRVMQTAGIFESQSRKNVWTVTKDSIESSFPSFMSSQLLDE